MPKSRRLSNSSQEAFEEFCKENQPLSRHLSTGGDGASVGSFAKLPQDNKKERGQQILLKKRRSISSLGGSNKRHQPLQQSRPSVPTGKVTVKPTVPKASTAKESRPIGKNKENGTEKNDAVVLSPTPYWKVAQERGGIHSPRETRSAKKRKTGRALDFETTNMPNRDGLMVFSPPNQVVNAQREKVEQERMKKERNERIANNRKNGQLLVFSKDFENLNPLPPDAPQEEDSKEEKLDEAEAPDGSTQEPKKEPQAPPATADQSFSSVSMEDESDNESVSQTGKTKIGTSNGSRSNQQDSAKVMTALQGLDKKFTSLARRLSEQPRDPDNFVLEAKKKEINDLTEAKKKLEERNGELCSELKKVEKEFAEQQQDIFAEKQNLQAELDQLKCLRNELEQALEESQEKIDVLENELLPESEEQLKEALEKLQEYEEKLEESARKIKEYAKIVEDITAEKEKLSLKLEENQKYFMSQIENDQKMYREEREASQKKDMIINKLESSIAKIKQHLEEQQSIAAQKSQDLRDVTDQLNAANDEKEQLRTRLASALSQINADSEIESEKSVALRAVNEQNEYLQKRLNELEEQLKKSQADRDDAMLRLGTSDQREAELFDRLRESDRIRKEMHARLMVLIGSIRTFVRVRPILQVEQNLAPTKQSIEKVTTNDVIFKFSGNNGGQQGSKSSKYGCDDPTKNLVSIQEPLKDRGGLSQRQKKWTFGFDQVFAPSNSQDDIWEATEPLVQSTVDGFNVTVFAYGQTGSGKTYTMLGTGSETPGEKGIIPRSIRKLFDSKREIEELSQGQKWVSMKIEMLEIYNENVRDLLASHASTDELGASLKVVGGEAVGSIRQAVKTEAEVFKILKTAEKRRCVKATNSNATSSRSHLVFSIEYSVTSKDGSSNQVGKLNVCDLAGSERVSKSGATGSILKEAQHINLSLSTLSNVIEKLQAGEKNVPFRDSKLTSLLQNSLEGNSKTLCIVCCSPLQDHFHETLTSLRFAAKVGRVDLKAVHNFST
ncbi:kinesin motor domain containing protein [Nitzschia inconspicua]|uniref:Kinesin motor domain containing protein n=1 Tax=Nitzschia inconspicua TaxID=303405 RepID=A0A9K3LU96_9STRA|nr:kinesin motor domain containing protein [Nitzschia inconspicua]